MTSTYVQFPTLK